MPAVEALAAAAAAVVVVVAAAVPCIDLLTAPLHAAARWFLYHALHIAVKPYIACYICHNHALKGHTHSVSERLAVFRTSCSTCCIALNPIHSTLAAKVDDSVHTPCLLVRSWHRISCLLQAAWFCDTNCTVLNVLKQTCLYICNRLLWYAASPIYTFRFITPYWHSLAFPSRSNL